MSPIALILSVLVLVMTTSSAVWTNDARWVGKRRDSPSRTLPEWWLRRRAELRRRRTTTTIIPWMTTTTAPWVTTLPPGCRTDSGELVFPGQEKTITYQGGCQVCRCSYSGQLDCYIADCLIPMCHDAYMPLGGCCPRCPNGRNCQLPDTGDVIQAGRPVEIRGMQCECPPQRYTLPGIQNEADYTALCVPLTTVPTTIIPTRIPVGKR